MGTVLVHASRPTAAVLAPVLLRQGARLRRDIPVLPEAGGQRRGVEGTGRPLDVLVFGESTAAGVGVQTQRDGLGCRLAKELAGRTGRSVRWRVVARSGATASQAIRRLLPEAVEEEFDLAVVVFGVNDTLRLRSRRAWHGDIRGIIAALTPALRPGGRILLAGVPGLGSFGVLPQPMRAVLGQHARALDRDLGRLSRGSSVVLHAPVPPVPGFEMLAADRLHPNADAYALWAAQLAEASAGRIASA